MKFAMLSATATAWSREEHEHGMCVVDLRVDAASGNSITDSTEECKPYFQMDQPLANKHFHFLNKHIWYSTGAEAGMNALHICNSARKLLG